MSNPTNDKQLEELRDKILQEVESQLRGDYACSRVWEAWQVGTMTVDDFEPLEETVRPEEITDAVLQLTLANREQYAAEKVREELIKLSLTQKQKDNIEKRAYAFKLSQLGFSYGKIGKVMGVGKSTVQFWLRKQTNPNQGDKSE